MSTRSRMFASADELVNLVREFEQGTLPRERWDHPAYLAVAIWYLSRLPEREATETFIVNALRYHRIHGIDPAEAGGYNETLTLFWLALARQFLVASDATTSLLDLSNDFIEQYGHRPRLFLEYYSPARICSWRARQSWVEPDLKAMDGCLVREEEAG